MPQSTKAVALDAALTLSVSRPLDPFRLYRAHEVDDFLGMEPGQVYAIPVNELPRRYIGEYRTAIRFNGLDLMCYALGLDLVDWAGVRDAAARQIAPDLTAVPLVRRAA